MYIISLVLCTLQMSQNKRTNEEFVLTTEQEIHLWVWWPVGKSTNPRLWKREFQIKTFHLCVTCAKPDSPIKKVYSDHMEGHKRLHCSFCGKPFKNRARLSDHEAQHQGLFKFRCLYCNKGFNHKNDYSKHEETHVSTKKKVVHVIDWNEWIMDWCRDGFIRMCSERMIYWVYFILAHVIIHVFILWQDYHIHSRNGGTPYALVTVLLVLLKLELGQIRFVKISQFVAKIIQHTTVICGFCSER